MAIETLIETHDRPKKLKRNKKNKPRKGIVSFENEIINKDRALEVLSKLPKSEPDIDDENVNNIKEVPGTKANKSKKKQTKHINGQDNVNNEEKLSQQSTFENEGMVEGEESNKNKHNKKKKKNKDYEEMQNININFKQFDAASSKNKKKEGYISSEVLNSEEFSSISKVSKKKKKDAHTVINDNDGNRVQKKKVKSIDHIEKKNKYGDSDINDNNTKKIKKQKRKDDSCDEENDKDSIPNDVSENPKPSNTEESNRAKKRKKHMELQAAKKLKATLATQETVLNYLSKWKHSRSEWKFEKLKQIWISQNLFDSAKLPEEFWSTTLEYFTQSRGHIRNLILKDALKLIEGEKADEENPDEEYQCKLKRARDIVQTLQE